MGAKCSSTTRKSKLSSNKKEEPLPDNHSFIKEMPYSEQEKEEESYDHRNSRLRINHSMHKSSIVIVNEQTKEIKPADKQIGGKITLEELVTITKENINHIYKVDPQIVGSLNNFFKMHFLLFFCKTYKNKKIFPYKNFFRSYCMNTFFGIFRKIVKFI